MVESGHGQVQGLYHDHGYRARIGIAGRRDSNRGLMKPTSWQDPGRTTPHHKACPSSGLKILNCGTQRPQASNPTRGFMQAEVPGLFADNAPGQKRLTG